MSITKVAHRCVTCGEEWTDTQLRTRLGEGEIDCIEERLTPGCEVPSGECPECGAFCYLIDNPRKAIVYVEIRGGCMVAAYSNHTDAEIRLIDWDNAECNEEDRAACERLSKEQQAECPAEVF